MKIIVHRLALCVPAALAVLCGCEFIAGLEKKERLLPSVDAGSDGSADTCVDGKRSGDETDIDCGGSCAPCPDGDGCHVGSDCRSRSCSPGGVCLAPTCHDQVSNGNETDLDCGGEACSKCSAGQTCKTEADCISGICTSLKCVASCSDQVKDGDESDVDCGGQCSGCVLGGVCGSHADCESGVCEGGKCVDFVVWMTRHGGTSGTDAARLVGLGVDSTGNAVIAANFTGKLNLGGPSAYDTTSISSQGFAFGRFDPVGGHVWDAGYVTGSTLKSQTVHHLAVSSSGSFVALGDYESTGINFGNGVTLPTVSPAPIQVFTASFNPSSVATSARKYGGASGLNGLAFGGLATDSLGGALVTVGSGNFGNYNLTTANTTTVAVKSGDMFVLNVNGNWGKTFNDSGTSDGFAGVAMDTASAIVAAGNHTGIINFGGGFLDSATMGVGFVVKFASSGAFLWNKSFGAAPDKLAIDAQGNVIVCGEFSSSVDFGLGPLTSSGSAVYVVKIDSQGNAMWNKAFTIDGAPLAVSSLVTTDVQGNILVAINAPAAILDLGAGPLMGSFFVAKLDPSGAHIWSKGFGTGKLDKVVGVAAYDDGDVLIGGNFQGTLSASTKVISSLGATDIFLARLRLPQ